MLAPFSLTPVLDTNGLPIRTACLMIYQAGTTTPAVLYKTADYQTGTEHPNPIPVNGARLLPSMYGAGAFKLRALSAPVGGSILWEVDGVTLTDPVAASTGTGTNTGLVPTGAIVQFYGTGSRVGYVRLNGRTIGNAASGATERAQADTLALYLSLWSEDDALVVVGGRGQSAQQDFDAGKAITLPDARGRVLASLDGMGNTSANSFTGLTWNAGGSGTRLGSFTGTWAATIGVANLPAHSHPNNFGISGGGGFTASGSTGNANVDHFHAIGVSNYSAASGTGFSFLGVYAGPAANAPASQSTSNANPLHSHTFSFTQGDHTHALSGSVGNAGSGTALSIANPILLVTTYIKL